MNQSDRFSFIDDSVFISRNFISKVENHTDTHLQNEDQHKSVLCTQEKLSLSSWGLPEKVLEFYKRKGVHQMFPWQLECLLRGNVLNGGNLVYSAPTSAGKTLVAEILMMQTVLEKKKKVLFILPFISVVREKMFYFQDMLSGCGVRVEGFMGGHSPGTCFKQVQLAICTIEKANSLINKMMEEKTLGNLGMVVVDELHLLGDQYRGYLLELLLTKLKYMSSRLDGVSIQIVGMSATLPNLNLLSNWLKADLYYTEYRPVPLSEKLKCGRTVYDNEMQKLHDLEPPVESIGDDSENIGYLCLQTISNGHSVLIFCPTKAWCQNLASNISSYFKKNGNSESALVENTPGWFIRRQLDFEKINQVLGHLRRCPAGLDKDLEPVVSCGVGFHHAGLTLEERDILAGSFRNGSIKVLVATSTLSSGVNLPARRVIVRSPMSFGSMMDVMTYRQMIGRAGRMGVDVEGESILICKPNERHTGQNLMASKLKPVESCLGKGRLSASLKRAVLEVVASGVASTPEDVLLYTSCTLLASSQVSNIDDPLEACIQFLKDNEFIRLQDNDQLYTATPLAQACLASSLPPDEGLALFRELQRARKCFVLETDLHIIYQVTPYSVSEQWTNIDWLNAFALIESLPESMKRVGELVGVEESFLVSVVRGSVNNASSEYKNKLSIHRRFYTALALQDLINEMSLSDVSKKYNCNKGMLQSLQQSSATYAGMVTEFTRRLGWGTLSLIFSQFQERLQFGVHTELCELMTLPILNAARARAIYNAGFTSLADLANANTVDVENALLSIVPFLSSKEINGETTYETEQRNKLRTLWVTGKCNLTVEKAALMIINEARSLIQLKLGIETVKWGQEKEESNKISSTPAEIRETSHMPKETDGSPFKADPVSEADLSIKCVTSAENKQFQNDLNKIEPNDIDAKSEPTFDKCFADKMPQSLNENQNVSFASPLPVFRPGRLSDDLFATPIVTKHPLYQKTPFQEKNDLKLQETPLGNENKSINMEKCPSTPDVENIQIKPNITPLMRLEEPSSSCSPDLFSESLTFDTQMMNEACNTDDLGFYSDFMPVDEDEIIKDSKKPEEKVPVKVTKNGIGLDKQLKELSESFFKDISMVKTYKPTRKDLGITGIHGSFFNNSFISPVAVEIKKGKRKTCKNSPDVIQDSDESLLESKPRAKKMKMFKKPGVITRQMSKVLDIDSDEEEILPTPNQASHSRDWLSTRPKPFCSKVLSTQFSDEPHMMRDDSMEDKSTQSSETEDYSIPLININETKERIEEMNIIDVTANKEVFDCFKKELNIQTKVALTLGCIKKEQEKMSKIGCNIRKRSVKNEKEEVVLRSGELVLDGLAFCWGNTDVFYYKMEDTKVISLTQRITFLEEFFKTTKCVLRIFDAKEQIKLFKKLTNITISTQLQDPKVASWLLQPQNKPSNITSLVLNCCPTLINVTSIFGHVVGTNSPGVSGNSPYSPSWRACGEALVTFHLLNEQLKMLEDLNLHKVFNQVEMPVIQVIAESELSGFSVNKLQLSETKTVLEQTMSELENAAYDLARRRFSLSSHNDVCRVLYSELKLKCKDQMFTRNKKPSVSKEALQQLSEETKHALPSIILQWRKLGATLSKVIFPLLQLPTNKVYGICDTHTATGRITMHEPNLQNIPRNFQVCVNNQQRCLTIRDLFICDDSESILISADYCQLELRILAHLSQDLQLIVDINSSTDVFVSIAATTNNMRCDEVTDELRQRAKQMCYGIIYGIGSKSLSQQLQISEAEALAFMEEFKTKYKGVQRFLQETVEFCRKFGYVETLVGRRRYIPSINKTTVSVKNEAERQAVNTRIQGSAADLVKCAMINFHRTASKLYANKINLLLHLHDELIYQVPKNMSIEVATLLKKEMETAKILTVSLPVKLKSGVSWGTLEPFNI